MNKLKRFFKSISMKGNLGMGLIALILITACTTIERPLDNLVFVKFQMAGRVSPLTDTLTITAHRMDGGDTLLTEQPLQNVDSFMVRMSYHQNEDEYILSMTDTLGYKYKDTIWVAKENYPHFESIDFAPTYFHTITGVRHTYNTIDSIVINNKNVTYDATNPHFIIYFREHN